MNRALIYFVLAGLAVVLQTGVMPLLLPNDCKPDLILILVIYMGLHEGPWRGGAMVYLMGWCFDAVAGVFPGLHGFVLLAIFLAVRGIVTRVNTESSPLLLLLVMAGTLLQSLLLAFSLDFFQPDMRIWLQIVWLLPFQMLSNLFAAFLLLRLTIWLQRSMLPHRTLPGLRKIDSRYET